MVEDRELVPTKQAPPERASIAQMAKWAVGTSAPIAAFSLISHNVSGLLVAGAVAFVASRHGQQALDSIHDHLEFPKIIDQKLTESKQKRHNGRTPLQRAFGIFPDGYGKDETAEAMSETVPEDEIPEQEQEEDTIFVPSSLQSEVPGIPRITIEQIVAHTEHNSFEVYIGRSMTRPGNPAVKINFYKRHLKLIGASQHGKSSMAAALLEAIAHTHDPQFVQVALLDLEDKTSRLLADVPHVVQVKKHGELIRLHARGYEQVLEHLGYISGIIDLRYGMSPEELERQPVLIVYLEEFVDLKDYFKAQMNGAERDEKEQARQNYEVLVYTIKKIAARGLKVLVQLLMCAQVDYRDDDLQAALVNVTSGMSFCVRPSAAQAAGFYQSELLARNAKEDKIGQAVVEMPDCKDLILAPEYDLGDRLKALVPGRSQFSTAREYSIPSFEEPIPSIIPMYGYRQTEDEPVVQQASSLSSLERQALDAWNEGHTSIRQMAAVLDVSTDDAYKLICKLDAKRLIVREKRVKS